VRDIVLVVPNHVGVVVNMVDCFITVCGARSSACCPSWLAAG
jgi:D-serine deaminase-like pyridoxal phosphate-dependent protein